MPTSTVSLVSWLVSSIAGLICQTNVMPFERTLSLDKRVSSFYQLKNCIPTKDVLKAIHAFITSWQDYCNFVVFGVGHSPTHSLQIMQLIFSLVNLSGIILLICCTFTLQPQHLGQLANHSWMSQLINFGHLHLFSNVLHKLWFNRDRLKSDVEHNPEWIQNVYIFVL